MTELTNIILLIVAITVAINTLTLYRLAMEVLKND